MDRSNSHLPPKHPLTTKELASLLGKGLPRLYYIARKRDLYYQRGEKKKPDGRIRVFYKPRGELKNIQRTIHRKILKELPVHYSIHSYRKKRDQLTNARPHVGKQYMIKLDIKDFFPTVTPERVFNTFMKLGFSEYVCKLLVCLTTYQNQLPQGPPTSPGIANLVLFPLARRFEKLCLEHMATFTIFGDDLTISGSERILKLKNLFMRIINDEGFNIHPDKIEICNPHDKKKVTGVVVNKKPNIDKEYYRLLRSQIHNCRVKSDVAQLAGPFDKLRRSFLGKINHVRRLNPAKGQKLLEEFSRINWFSGN